MVVMKLLQDGTEQGMFGHSNWEYVRSGVIPVTGVEQKEEKVGMFRCDMAYGRNVSENARRMTRLNIVHKHPEPELSKLEPHARVVHVKKCQST